MRLLHAVLPTMVMASAASAEPRFMGLGDLPGGRFNSGAWGVSADGSTVVGTSEGTSGLEAFRWTAASGMEGLGDVAGGSFYSQAWGVSADGSTVVGQGTSASGTEAFRWTAGTGIVGLGDLPGGTFYSNALGASADGSVVVGFSSSTSSLGGAEAFRWTSEGGMVDLGNLPGAYQSAGTAISNDGSVIVGYSSGQAYRWTAATGMVSLGAPPAGYVTPSPTAVSADGLTVVGTILNPSGGCYGTNDGSCYEAFRWTAATGWVIWGPETKAGSGIGAKDVSGDGSIILFGGSIWDEVHGMRNLRDVLHDYGLDLTGWSVIQPDAISDDGLTFVGAGFNPSGNPEAWIAVIPEPSTGLLFGAGLVALAAARRRTESRVSLS